MKGQTGDYTNAAEGRGNVFIENHERKAGKKGGKESLGKTK